MASWFCVVGGTMSATRISPSAPSSYQWQSSPRGASVAERTELLLRRFSAEHDELRDVLSLLRDAADLLTAGSPGALARPLGGPEATASMSRAHAEIQRLSGRIAVHLDMADAAGGLADEQPDDLLAWLYGLYTVLRLHFTQEEESYFTLAG